jgi:hypothetical protein
MVAKGRRPLIAVENIPKLNEKALVTVVMTEKGSDNLVSSMQSLVAKDRVDRGLTPQLTSSQPSSIKLLSNVMHLLELIPPTTVESYLNNNKNNAFPTVDSDGEKLDGCYVTLDNVRRDPIGSGFAEQGQGRQWKEYLRASHLTDRNKKDRPQCQCDPHESVGDDEAPNRTGTVSQLQQKMAMGMRKCDADRILWIFNWTEIDEAMLKQLPYRSEGGGSLASKKNKHECFMFELFLAVALERTSQRTTQEPVRVVAKALLQQK